MEDQHIVLLCQQGETKGLEKLVLKYESQLYRFCFYLCSNADQAAELFQDTWLKALRNIYKYNAQGSFLGWLFTIAANLQRDQYRKQKRRQNILGQQQQPSPESHMPNCEEQVLVQQALETLDNSLRIPVILFYFEDLPLESIANLMKIPQGTVKSRLHRARKRLKKQLEVLL